MPLFDLQCTNCGCIAKDCLLISYDQDLSNNPCNACGISNWDILPPLVAMHPDTMWSGVKNEQGYFTSKSKHLSYLKENSLERADRSILEEVKKKSKNKVKEATEKNAKKTEQWLAKELAGV